MRFQSRDEAARLLADRLAPYQGHHPVVLGVPRGGVPMARIIADALDGDLDVVLVRKLRAPGQPELAIGAVDELGSVLKGEYFGYASGDYVREEVRAQQEILRARRERYLQGRPAIDVAGRTAIVVDDGIATGSTMRAVVHLLRARGAGRIVVAIGVSPDTSLTRLGAEADEVVCLQAPAFFHAVGQFFEDFSEVTDEMVIEALARPEAPTARAPAAGST